MNSFFPAIDVRYNGLAETIRALVPNTNVIFVGTMAFALHIARNLPLPSSEISCEESYYADQVHGRVLAEVGRLNEIMLIDVDKCVALVRDLWKSRYFFAYPKEYLSLVKCQNSTALSSMFGAEHFLAEEDVRLLEAEQIGIRQILNHLTTIERPEKQEPVSAA